MAVIAGYFTESGSGWRLARSLSVLVREVAQAYPAIYGLGSIGDATHSAQGTSSDHNPFVTGPDGLGIVRAMDFGGPYDDLMDLRGRLYALGRAQFGPLYPYGYLKGPDSQGNAWPIGTGWNANSGDEGHLHVSVTQANGLRPVAGTAGYVAAIDSTQTWGIASGISIAGSGDILMEDDMYDQDARDEVIGRIDVGFADMRNQFNALLMDDTRTRIGLIQWALGVLLDRDGTGTGAVISSLSDADAAKLAKAVNDDAAKRLQS